MWEGTKAMGVVLDTVCELKRQDFAEAETALLVAPIMKMSVYHG
jgi:hypothetical protein